MLSAFGGKHLAHIVYIRRERAERGGVQAGMPDAGIYKIIAPGHGPARGIAGLKAGINNKVLCLGSRGCAEKQPQQSKDTAAHR